MAFKSQADFGNAMAYCNLTRLFRIIRNATGGVRGFANSKMSRLVEGSESRDKGTVPLSNSTSTTRWRLLSATHAKGNSYSC